MYDAALAPTVMDMATTRTSTKEVIFSFMDIDPFCSWVSCDRVSRMITGSKAAFAALVFADAFFQHGKEVFVGQIHR